MVTIKKHDGNFIFSVNGMHKLWAFKSELHIPVDHIVNAHQDTESIKGWKGLKMAGTNLPGILTAGTFHKDGNKIFWDVSDSEKCIIIQLKDEDYSQLVIEVENPAESIKTLTSK